ncbi:MAG: aldo/keto reductase [Gammaproteobacteria bacterium]
MKFANLGASGLRVSRLCFGIMTFGNTDSRKWALPESEGFAFIGRALEGGINFFDTAEVYQNGQSEEILGRALRHFGVHREDVVIATKVWGGTVGRRENRWGLSRKHILHEVDQSLRRLQTDYIDLYQIHRWDNHVPIEETLEALNDTVRAGKVRYIGASSMWAWQFERALGISERNGWAKFVSMQNFYNLVYREEEREMNPLCRDRGVGLIPWSPLARGFLGGNQARDRGALTPRAQTDKVFEIAPRDLENNFDILDRVIEVGKRHGRSPAQVSMAWLLAQPGVVAPITSATKIAQLDDVLGAVDFALPQQDLDYLGELYQPHRVTGHG